MATAPRPFGRLKNIRIPAGREAEYAEDATGNIIHKQYGSDDEIPDAIVLPSAKGHDRFGTGGQHRVDFDPLGRNLRQNIVLFDESGMQMVAKTTGHELARIVPKAQPVRTDAPADSGELTPEEADRLGEQAESMYRGMAAHKAMAGAQPVTPEPPKAAPAPQPVVPREPVLHIEEDYVPGAKKKKAKKSRRVVKSGAAPEDKGAQRENPLPVEVVIDAPFGRLSQSFSAVFIDNGNLVLCTDKRIVPLYTLPRVEEPMYLTVTWAGQTVRCVWAGICFTLPHVPVTFTVLLIDSGAEEPVDEQGQSGEGWSDQV